ncbi:MAG: TIR domain-containing protein [Burkholderiaceae bacterium]
MKPTDAAAPDVFISYARKNRPVAEQLAEGLSAAGLKVWWDSDLTAGSEFSAVIETKLLGAAVVIVMWSADSARSSFVRDESSRALKHDKLLPVRIEDIELPLGFGQLHTLDLLDWDGDTDDAAFEKLLLEVKQRRQRAPRGLLATPLPSPTPRRWPRRSSLMAAGALALASGAGVAWYLHDRQEQAAIAAREEQARLDKLQREEARRLDANKVEAERHFRAGLDAHIADVPQLEKALNEYLSSIERRPGHARAHYYLAHIYAQTGRPADALASFKLALAGTESLLDRGQRAEAQKQLLALAFVEGESAPVTRPPVADPALAAAKPTPPPAPGSTAVAAARPPAPDTLDPGIVTRSLNKPGGAARPPAPTPVAAAPAAPRQPPRSDPPTTLLTQLAAGVDGLFDDNKEARITATTRLVVDPQALSDAVPLAVDKALQVLKENPAALSASAASGVVNTLVLLQSALPGTLQMNRAAIGLLLAAAEPRGEYTAQQAGKVRLLLQQAQARHPLAYIQIANEAQRPLADTLAAKMRSFGYDAPAIELVGARAPETTQVRVQGKSDRSYARWVTKAVGEAIDARPGVSELRNARPGVDTYEIWFGRQLCAPGGRVLAGCAKA